jgi:acyl carrier protein
MATVHSDNRNRDGVTVAASSEAGDARLYLTIASVLGVDVDGISDESSPDTVTAWDSLNHLNIAMALETEFGLAFTAEDIVTMSNVRLIRQVLRSHGADL